MRDTRFLLLHQLFLYCFYYLPWDILPLPLIFQSLLFCTCGELRRSPLAGWCGLVPRESAMFPSGRRCCSPICLSDTLSWPWSCSACSLETGHWLVGYWARVDDVPRSPACSWSPIISLGAFFVSWGWHVFVVVVVVPLQDCAGPSRWIGKVWCVLLEFECQKCLSITQTQTQTPSQRQPDNGSSSSAGCRGSTWTPGYFAASTDAPSRVSWLAASKSGMTVALPSTRRLYRGWWKQYITRSSLSSMEELYTNRIIHSLSQDPSGLRVETLPEPLSPGLVYPVSSSRPQQGAEWTPASRCSWWLWWCHRGGQALIVAVELQPVGTVLDLPTSPDKLHDGGRTSPTSPAPAWSGSRNRTAASPSPPRRAGWCLWTGTQCPLVLSGIPGFSQVPVKKGHYSSWYPVGN